MANQQHQSLAQPYTALALDAENRQDLDLLRQATHDFTHWTPDLIQMDKDLAMLLDKSGYKPTEAAAKPKRGRKPKANAAPEKPKRGRGRPRKQPITVAQKHLAKYVRSIGKPQSPDNIMSMLKALQRDIQDGFIRKTDMNAHLVERLQQRLIQQHAKALKEGSCVLNTNQLDGIEGFGDLGCPGTNCSCSRSLNGPSPRTAAQRQLAKYRNLQGKVKTAPELERLIKSLHRDIEQERITKADPLASRIQSMQDNLIEAHKVAVERGCVKLEATEAVLNGLNTVISRAN